MKRGNEWAITREVEALRFVKQHTSIPIPGVIDEWVDGDGINFFTMGLVAGKTVRSLWPRMDSTRRQHIIDELKRYIDELRSLPPPKPGWIGSCSYGPALDQRINDGMPFGPLKHEGEFNDILLGGFPTYGPPHLVQRYRSLLSEGHGIVFTHGDLSDDNILVNEEGYITAILDWETAGWTTEYWEYRKGRYASKYETWWVDLMNAVMIPYEWEWQVDSDLEWF
jgi:serine/threonine protein kinase